MRQRWLVSMVTSLGITTLCCLWIVGPLVSTSHDTIYHWSGSAQTIFLPSILDFTFVWLVFVLLMYAALGTSRKSVVLWTALMLFLPWATLKSVSMFMDWYLRHWISRGLFGLCIAAFVFFNLRFKPIHSDALERFQKFTKLALSLVAFCGGIIFVQLLWFGWQARQLNVPRPLHQSTSASPKLDSDRPRIIWIVLDELSYQQVYEQRYPGLNLPAFDQLAKEATVFTRVVPAGIRTEIVMPSLIAGVPVDQIRASSAGDSLAIHNPRTKRWQIFDQHDTVFNDALKYSYRTAVAGWYNPYCRILPNVLDRCFWTLGLPILDKMVSSASVARNVVGPFLLTSGRVGGLPSAIRRSITVEDTTAKSHISDYRQISESADKLLTNSSYDLVLIHMAVPHPGGIYNRISHRFATRNSTYIDNLALADSYLAHVRSVLASEGMWDSSVVVVMGDHSWRTKLIWADAPDWTPEEEQASHGGQFDDRPAYIVKLSGQKQEDWINQPFHAVDTRMLFDAIMNKQITSPEELQAWIEELTHTHPQN